MDETAVSDFGTQSETEKRSSSLLPIAAEWSFCIIIEDISENPPAPSLDIKLAMPTCIPDPKSPGGEAAYAPGFPPGINWLFNSIILPFPEEFNDDMAGIG